MLVDVLLSDAKANTSNGLRAEDLDVLDEGVRQEIIHFSQDEIPLAIALVVDVSRSMQPGMEPLRRGLIRALPSLKQEDRVALISFAEGHKLHVELTRDFDKIARRIGGLNVQGLTNINDAIYYAAEYLREASPGGRRVIILVSDALATVHGKKPVEKALVESEVTLFGVRAPFWIDNRFFTREHLDQLLSFDPPADHPWAFAVERLASLSGGLVLDVKRPEGIQPAVEHLIQMVKTRYTLGFYPNPPGKPGSIRRIEIRLKNNDVEQVMPGAILTYRNRYRVPPETATPSRSGPGGGKRP